MDVHKAQRTGNMHYVYLPSSWCKKQRIKAQSPVGITTNADGTLTLSPDQKKPTGRSLKLTVPELDHEVLIKLIIACYVNPLQSFQIHCEKEADVVKLLDQKTLIGALDFVEFDKDTITYELGFAVQDPFSVFMSMMRKVQNMLHVMMHSYSKNLIARYEDEVDKAKLMIDKAVICALSESLPSKLSPIELHYVSLLAQHVERLVDYLTKIEESDKKFIEHVKQYMDSIKKVLPNSKEFNYKEIAKLTKYILTMKQPAVSDFHAYYKRRIRSQLVSVCEVLMDWAVTNETVGSQKQ